MEMFLLTCFTGFLLYTRLQIRERGPTKIPFVKGISHGNKKPFGTKIKVNTCTNFVLGRLKKKKKKMEKSGFCNFT